MIEVSRRRILQSGTLAAAGILVPVGTATAAKAPASLLSRARFEGLVGSRFTLSSGDQGWTCRLMYVGDLLGAPAGADGRFRLTFTTSAAGPGQGVHTFSRPGFTSTELFVVTDAARRDYVAVVNRL